MLPAPIPYRRRWLTNTLKSGSSICLLALIWFLFGWDYPVLRGLGFLLLPIAFFWMARLQARRTRIQLLSIEKEGSSLFLVRYLDADQLIERRFQHIRFVWALDPLGITLSHFLEIRDGNERVILQQFTAYYWRQHQLKQMADYLGTIGAIKVPYQLHYSRFWFNIQQLLT